MKGRSDLKEGDLLWKPGASRISEAQITKFQAWLESSHGLVFDSYEDLWSWSVTDIEMFWRAIWDYFEVISDKPLLKIVDGEDVFKAKWFEGTRTNYAEHLLRHEASARLGDVAICHSTEIRLAAEMSWQELGGKVRILATKLRELGIKPGDRIVSYMPNVPETVIAMIATVAIGAVWSSAAPEFGHKTVVDRFKQISPVLAFFADGYSYDGRIYDRREEIGEIARNLPSLKHSVWLNYTDQASSQSPPIPVIEFEDMLSGPQVSIEDFRYERVEYDHPLWVLYSSGTTGLPKAIIHSHVGMILEHLKVMTLHCDLGPTERMFFYTTTGWMMWNSVVSALITGASVVLYDGSPVFGSVGMLWRMAAETKTTSFGASPTLVQNMKQAGVKPKDLFDLSALRTITVGGAPSTPETFQWFYEYVGEDLWVSSQSGGTDLCSGIVLGNPTLPVHAGEIQCRALGIDAHIWSDDGDELVGEVGELVITSPFPSAPLGFWGDSDGTRYFESYFSTFEGIWRHGDLGKITVNGGAYIYGRSDSTLNRFGVRIGSAEIYRVLEQVEYVMDSLVVCCETSTGGYYMPMFVEMEKDLELTEDIRKQIVSQLRHDASPRHVPDEIHQVPRIPYTLTGKKMEIPIRKIFMGVPVEKAVSRDAMAEPEALDWFIEFAERHVKI